MEKYLPPPRSAKIIPFPIRQRKESSIDAKIKYLRSIYHDHSQPFEARARAALQAAALESRRGA